MSANDLLRRDRAVVWHPYAPLSRETPLFAVRSARGCRLQLADGRELIDGTASWWSALHGYNHPVLNAAIETQLQDMAHVMFGGLTHEPAVQLCERLIAITPPGLERVFLSDSGSVSVEIALKMALQYWLAVGRPQKQRLLTIRGGYHGDTFGTMALSDPEAGMHRLFGPLLTQHLFAEQPGCRFHEPCTDAHLAHVSALLEQHAQELAAVILEPIAQCAGGLHFYAPDWLKRLRQLCDQHDVLLIADEIATGFGRTGRLFACEHAGISPDILCLGKALTGGYLPLAATLCNARVAEGIAAGKPGAFMHGPTFMANPLACRVALASLDLLATGDWQAHVQRIETAFRKGLLPLAELPAVRDVRVLGAIGVVEMQEAINLDRWQPALVDEGLWVRPFGRWVYAMPPFVISDDELEKLTGGMGRVVNRLMDLS